MGWSYSHWASGMNDGHGNLEITSDIARQSVWVQFIEHEEKEW